jgi:hypothetical protein
LFRTNPSSSIALPVYSKPSKRSARPSSQGEPACDNLWPRFLFDGHFMEGAGASTQEQAPSLKANLSAALLRGMNAPAPSARPLTCRLACPPGADSLIVPTPHPASHCQPTPAVHPPPRCAILSLNP